MENQNFNTIFNPSITTPSITTQGTGGTFVPLITDHCRHCGACPNHVECQCCGYCRNCGLLMRNQFIQPQQTTWTMPAWPTGPYYYYLTTTTANPTTGLSCGAGTSQGDYPVSSN